MDQRYIRHPEHARTSGHYYVGQWGYSHLAVSPDWWAENMPENSGYSLRAVYLDRDDGKTYETWIWAAWDDQEDLYLDTFDEDWNPERMPEAKILGEYFYGSHHCACHRKQAVAACGAVTDNECGDDRFAIVKIFHPKFPDLVLYSETMSCEELNAAIEAGRNAEAV